MRPLYLLLAAMLVVACAPRGDENATADTTAAVIGAPANSGRASIDSAAAGGTAASVPTTTPTATRPARTGAAPRIPQGDRADSTRNPRIAPPTKAPGGYRMVPNAAPESLRMARPESTTRRP